MPIKRGFDVKQLIEPSSPALKCFFNLGEEWVCGCVGGLGCGRGGLVGCGVGDSCFVLMGWWLTSPTVESNAGRISGKSEANCFTQPLASPSYEHNHNQLFFSCLLVGPKMGFRSGCSWLTLSPRLWVIVWHEDWTSRLGWPPGWGTLDRLGVDQASLPGATQLCLCHSVSHSTLVSLGVPTLLLVLCHSVSSLLWHQGKPARGISGWVKYMTMFVSWKFSGCWAVFASVST